jgi:HSP20 family molecular chaperone IbpA
MVPFTQEIAMADLLSKSQQNAALTPFGGDFDRLFNRMMRNWPFGWPESPASSAPRALRAFEHMPNVEVKENGKSYAVSVELQGLDEGDVKVVVEDDVLTVTGEKKVERSDEKTHSRSAATAASPGPSRCRSTPTATPSRRGSPRAYSRELPPSAFYIASSAVGLTQINRHQRASRRRSLRHRCALEVASKDPLSGHPPVFATAANAGINGSNHFDLDHVAPDKRC